MVRGCVAGTLLLSWRRAHEVCATMQAAANAKNNLGLRKAKLYVSECMADGGPVLKRIRPRAKGRCGLELRQKASFHLHLSVYSACKFDMRVHLRELFLWLCRAARILKPTFHLVVKVSERES